MSQQATARCPYCMEETVAVHMSFHDDQDRVRAGRCSECSRLIVRVNDQLVHPLPASRESRESFEGMPEELRTLCTEARAAAEVSPRAACALLAPYVERICDHLGAEGETLDEKVRNLRETGKVPEGLDGYLASVQAETQEEEVTRAKKQAYELMRVAHFLAPMARDFWPAA